MTQYSPTALLLVAAVEVSTTAWQVALVGLAVVVQPTQAQAVPQHKRTLVEPLGLVTLVEMLTGTVEAVAVALVA